MAGSERDTRPAVKLSDVAAAAGVAPMTVSRVINTPDRVSPHTAARVRAAIEKLGYVPNLVAGGLSSRRSRMVAAIVPTIAHPMFAEMVQHFTETMRGAGYQVMLSLSGYGDFAELDLVRGLLARRPDAMLVTGADHAPPLRQMLAEAGIPVVEIWDVSPQPVDMLVGLDHVQAGAAVAALFLAKGIDSFAVFAASDTRAQARRRGFTDAVRAGRRHGAGRCRSCRRPARSPRDARRWARWRRADPPHRAVLQLRLAGVRRHHRGARARHRRARSNWRCAASAISSWARRTSRRSPPSASRAPRSAAPPQASCCAG